MNDCIYDLRESKIIAPYCSTHITGNNCIIIEHKYDFTSKFKFPLGIYRIDLFSAEITYLDDLK